MWTVILALGAGFACGLVPGARSLRKANRILNTVGLLALLGGMGIELGGNEAVMSNLQAIGIAAAALAGSAALGSVLFTLPLLPWLDRDNQETKAGVQE